MVRTWQSTDGKLSQPEIGSPEWKAFVQAHFERAKNSFGQVSLKQIGPFEVQDHPLPYDQVKSQYYRRLLGDGQFTLPIIVEERPEGGYRLVDGIHRLGVHQALNRPVMALVVQHGLQKMAIKDIQMGRRIPTSPGHMLGYHRFDYSHTLPSSLSSQGYRLNVYHDPESANTEERFVTAVLTHPKTLHTSRNFPGQVGAVSAHLQPNGELSIGTASIDEAHRGGKGLPLYEALLTHASKKLGAHTVTGGWHSTMAHKVHQKLALKHGMDYNAGPNKAMKTPENTPSGPHDGKFDSYSYAIKNEAMEKAIGPFIASMMMAASPGPTDQSVEQPKHQIAATLYKPWSPEGLHEDLVPIAHLESSWGKNIAHGKGKNEMDTAFGALGFKPQTAFEEYGRSKKIQKEHPGLNDSETFLNEFRGNPSFYNKIASQHFARLKALHGTAQKAAYAWRWGSRAASEAAPETIDNEPYVQKYTAFKNAKKLGKSQREKEPTRVVSVAAYNEDGLLLFGLRGDTSKWCMPGGHLEPGEDKLDGAKRELKEETGLEGVNWKYLGMGEVPEKGVQVFCYTCDVEGFPDADSDPDLEFLHFEWVDSNEIPEHIRSALHNKQDINLELQDIDHDLAKGMMGDWKAEGYTLHHNGHMGLDINDPKNDKLSEISAHDPAGNKIGWLAIGTDGDPAISPMKGNVKIDPAHRRKGLASAMYAMAEKIHGKTIEPEEAHTSFAEAMWRQPNRTFGPAELPNSVLTDKNPPTDPGALKVYNSTPHKYKKSEDLNKAMIPLSNVFLLNRWGHPISPDRVSYHLQPGANTPPIKVQLGPDDIGEYSHVNDPQVEQDGEVLPFDHSKLLDPSHPKYFVSDGHHRVRAAQERGDTHIEAEVHIPETPHWLKGDKKAQYEAQVGAEAAKLGKSEDLIKMAAKKPKIAPEEKNLVVTHNISDLGLEHAHKIGGLPAPSLAIAHKDHPLEGFGDITLVAHHSLADPAQHPVFDADIYSPRQPRSQHKFNDKKMSKLVEELRPHFKAIGSDWASSIGDEFKKYGPSLTRAGSYNVARGLQHRWLTEQGVEIPNYTKPKGLLTPFTQEPALQNFFKEHGVNSQYDYDSDYGKKLGEATRAAINSWNPEGMEPEDVKDMRDFYHKEFINPDNGDVFFGRSSRIFKDHANFGQNEPDSQKMNEWVENKTKELGEDKFHEWAEKKLEPFSEGQYIPKHSPATGNVRKIPYTLENILKEMTKTVRQGEDFNYGLGSIRAGGAKKFKNLEQMRQHQGQIMPKKEFEKVKEHMNERWNALNEELSPYHGSKMSSMSALGEAISESYKRGRYLGSQLKLSGFDHVPPEVQRKVHEFAQDLVRMPTEYFEAKPQRVVGLNEFKGAVIPHDSHPRIEQRLKENGIHDIRFYDKNKEGDRAKAIRLLAEAQNLHLSEDEFYGETLMKELDSHLEEMAKARPGPTFPQLGVGDDRRETDQVTTPRQLKIKQLAQANAAAGESDKRFDQIYSSGAATYGKPEEMKARARSRIKQDFTQSRGNLGAAPARGATSASYALGTPWLAGPGYSPSTPNAIQLHENNHMVFKRIEEQHGFQSRKNLAQNLWHHAEQVIGPEASKILNRYLEVRYPMKFRGDVDHEERIGTVLNLVNDPGERNLLFGPNYAHIVSKPLPNGRTNLDTGPLMAAAKKAHQALHAAGAFADRDWLAPHPEFRGFYPEMARDNGWDKPAKPATAKPSQMSDDELLAELGKNEVKWFTDDEPGTRILALKSKNPNPKILEDALNDENPYVREFAAQHPALTFEHLFSALSHKDPATRLAALKNPGITEEHLEFAQHDPDLAEEVLKHPKGPTNKVGDLTKNIGYVEFPKLGQGVATKPMVLSIDQAKDRKVLMGDRSKSVSGGKMFYNENVKPDKRLPARQRKMSGYVLDNSGDALKGRIDHEAQHSVFQAIGQKHGTHAHHAAVEHVLGAISDRERSILTMLNPQLAKYPAGKRGEEMIAYMQNFLQDRSRREAALANFAPNGRRLTEVGQRKVTATLKDMWKRMRNRAHEFGPEHIEAYKKRVMKSDADTVAVGEQLIKQIPGHQEYNVLQDLAGSSLVDAKVIKAAEFLSGKKCDMMKFRHAFWQTEDQYTAGLMSVDMEPTEDNKKALKAIADLQEVNKGENHVDAGIKEVKAVFKEDEHVAEALQRGVDSQFVTVPELEGKHVGGIRTVQDPNSKEVFLLKPGSGSVSPAAGVSNQPASPSQREACFYEVAKLVGLEDRFVETHLMNVDGKYVAAMHMLPHNWTNLEKLKFQSKSMPGSVLEKYRVTGELHTWGILDYILGNPDRHGQNLMVGPEEENHPVQLIDHGSALAGDGFDPAHDEDSFIPYYFRAWNQRTFRNTDSPEQRLKLMPKTSDAGRSHIQEFILKLNPAELEGVLAKYSVEPRACLKRLEHVKHLLSNGIALDEGVNKLWVLGA